MPNSTPRDLAHLKFLYDGSQPISPALLQLLTDYNMQAIDLHPHLEGSSNRYLDEFMELCVKDAECYIVPPMSLVRLTNKPFMSRIVLLSESSVPGGVPVQDQICARIGHRPGRDDSFVDAYQTSGVSGIRALGATIEEARRLALTERLSAGGTLRDEAVAASLLGNILPKRSDDSHLVYEFSSSPYWVAREEHVRRSLLDHMLIEREDRELALLISTRDPDGDVTSMVAFATERADIDAAVQEARGAGYGINTSYDPKTGISSLLLHSRNITFPVKGFAQFFTGAPVSVSA